MKKLDRRVKRINTLINKKRYIKEVKDYWKTPSEFKKKGGDCEDFAIAKYFELKRIGISQDKLQITYVKLNNRPHMVLVYNNLVLDNTINKILPLEQRTDIEVIYSFNESLLFKSGKIYKNNLKIWHEMINRKNKGL